MDMRPIIHTYRKPLISVAFRMLGNMEEAKDTVQDTFIRFWMHKSDVAGEPFSWLCRVLMNLCIDRLRRRKITKLFSIEGYQTAIRARSEDDPQRTLENSQLVHCVEKTAERLKPVQKAVFLLRDVEGYTIKEISEMTGYTENNIRVNLHLARKNMRKWLQPLLREGLGQS